MIGQPSRDLHVLSSVGTSSLGFFRAGREDWRDKAPIAKWQRISAFVYLVCMFESGSNTIAYWVALLLGPRGEPKA